MSICQICGGEYKKLRLHLKSHQIDPMDYWVKYISDTHEYPVCKNCGDPIHHFINDSFDCGPGVYCCKQCMDEDLPNVLSERHEKGIYLGTSYLTTTWNSDISLRMDSLARTSYRRLLRDADPFSEGYLYVIILNQSTLKFGATRQDLDYYINFRYQGFESELVATYKGTLLSVAGIEYLIKMNPKFKDRICEGWVSSTEELELGAKDDLINYLDSISRLIRMK